MSVDEGASMFGNYGTKEDSVPDWASSGAPNTKASAPAPAPTPAPAPAPAHAAKIPQPMTAPGAAPAVIAEEGEPIPADAEFLWDGRKIIRSEDGSILWSVMGGQQYNGKVKGSFFKDGFPLCSISGIQLHLHWSWIVYMIFYIIAQFVIASHQGKEAGPYMGIVFSVIAINLGTILVHGGVEVVLTKMWGGKPYSLTLWIFGVTWKSLKILGPRKTFMTALLGSATHAGWLALAIIGVRNNPLSLSGDDYIMANFDLILCIVIIRQQIFLLAACLIPASTWGGGTLDGARMVVAFLYLTLGRSRVRMSAKIASALGITCILGFGGYNVYLITKADYDMIFLLYLMILLASMVSLLGAISNGSDEAVMNHAMFRCVRTWATRRAVKRSRQASKQSAAFGADEGQPEPGEDTALLWTSKDSENDV